jgi:hypothetical protein
MEKDNSSGPMVPPMMENFKKTIFMEKENMFGVIKESLSEIGNSIKWMEREFSLGQVNYFFFNF